MENNENNTVSSINPHKIKKPRKKMVFNLTFGIPALMFAIIAASLASVMSLMGFSVIFTDWGLVPMAVCLMSTYLSALPAVICGVMSQKLGMVTGLNKVSIALSVASCATATIIFLSLVLAVFTGSGIFGH